MTRLHITIDLGSAAFSDGGSEVSRVLRRLAGRIDTYGTEYVAGKTLTTTAGDECGEVRLVSTSPVIGGWNDSASDTITELHADGTRTERPRK